MEETIQSYSALRGIKIENRLGHGTDGSVFQTNVLSAVKVFQRERQFRNELGCYQRLAETGCFRISIFAIPELQYYHESLRVIEMSVVRPPYLPDFGKCYLDVQPPDFPADVIQHEIERQMEDFGEDYSIVQMAIAKLQEFGI
ncbi:hypothetical protein [Blastopirellula retiformator]|uniref:Uncharacterized protein n=1 Tax=Blastopirellula retiformator TaxID=2527970 RepID=A0A5C5VP37_9BACT|nr:hypothetical protein [Blastopirellula retiformator]TWT39743.1 hypothetical protein Enr8_14450 [Blastopirellula retiformator]